MSSESNALSKRSASKGTLQIASASANSFFVYILRTSSNRLYIGVTENLEQRISTHNSGKGAKWIKPDRDARLVYSEHHQTLGSARKREIPLKGWSRKKKEALIAGNFAKLKSLSRSIGPERAPASRRVIRLGPSGLAHDCATRSHSTNLQRRVTALEGEPNGPERVLSERSESKGFL